MINDLLEWLIPRAPRGNDILQAQNIGRICFRGGTPPPDEIFQGGLTPRRSTGIVFRERQADIDPESAACVTPGFLTAAVNRYAHEPSTDGVFVEDSSSINLNFDDNLPERQHGAEVPMGFLRDISGRLHDFPTSGSGYHANDPRSLDGV